MSRSPRKRERIIRLRIPETWAFALFALIAGFLLFSEHRAHLFGVLPLLLLLACPLLHIFMHRGHGGHGHRGNPQQPPERGQA